MFSQIDNIFQVIRYLMLQTIINPDLLIGDFGVISGDMINPVPGWGVWIDKTSDPELEGHKTKGANLRF